MGKNEVVPFVVIRVIPPTKIVQRVLGFDL